MTNLMDKVQSMHAVLANQHGQQPKVVAMFPTRLQAQSFKGILDAWIEDLTTDPEALEVLGKCDPITNAHSPGTLYLIRHMLISEVPLIPPAALQ